jgi:hypothetical protein
MVCVQAGQVGRVRWREEGSTSAIKLISVPARMPARILRMMDIGVDSLNNWIVF